MLSDFQDLTLDEVCEIITDGAHYSPQADINGLPMASVKDLTRYGINIESCKLISQKDFESLVSQGCSPLIGDILIAKDGNSALDTVCVYRQSDKVVLLSSIAILRPNERITPDYLNYYLDSEPTRKFLKENFRSGSAIPRVVLRDFRLTPIKVPSLEIQYKIGNILRTLDDKIELNRRMNHTLEALAQAIFKSWFVDFDPVWAKMAGRKPNGMDAETAALFPAGFEESELGQVPRGWEVRKVESIAEKVACGPFGASIKVETFVDTGVPVISGKHLHGIRLLDEDNDFITEEHAEKLSNANVFRGDVIFTHAGNIGQAALIPGTSKYTRYVLSQRQFYLRCNRKVCSPYYLVHYFKSPEGQHQLLANTSSTGVPSISRPVSYLKSIKLLIPPKKVFDRFDELVNLLHLKAGKLDSESNTLATLRDALMPKLISGEVRVREAEKMVEEAL